MLRTRVIANSWWGIGLALATVVLLTIVSVGDRFVSAWMPKPWEPAPITYRVPSRVVVATRGDAGQPASFRQVDAPVVRGEMVRPNNPQHRRVLAYESARRPPRLSRILGFATLYVVLLLSLTTYLRRFAQNRLRLVRNQLGILALLVVALVLAKAQLLWTPLSPFWIPEALIPLWVAVAYDRKTALLVGLVLAFLVASLVDFDWSVLSTMLVRSVATMLLLMDRKRGPHMLLAGVLGGLCGAATFMALEATTTESVSLLADLVNPRGSHALANLMSGVVVGAGGVLLRGPVERILGHVPRERLLLLQDLQQPLLLQLSERSPGTYEHSRSMANLAEQAVSAIGGDALLTRVGAYYHDLGKSLRPEYFVENLERGQTSPHDLLAPEESAAIIRSHVVEGTRILREGGIPESVVEFAYTHHADQVIEFFWHRCVKQGNPKGLKRDDFRYPGMRPQTKETGILLLVDSIEAASRTVDPPNRESFEQLVKSIVFEKLRNGLLDESGLSMKDLRVVTCCVADALVNMHHHRIKYPWQVEKAQQFGVSADSILPSRPKAASDELKLPGSGGSGSQYPAVSAHAIPALPPQTSGSTGAVTVTSAVVPPVPHLRAVNDRDKDPQNS